MSIFRIFALPLRSQAMPVVERCALSAANRQESLVKVLGYGDHDARIVCDRDHTTHKLYGSCGRGHFHLGKAELMRIISLVRTYAWHAARTEAWRMALRRFARNLRRELIFFAFFARNPLKRLDSKK